MVAQMEECQDYGIRTLVALDEQGEQLERIEDGKSNRLLQYLSHTSPLCVCVPSADTETYIRQNV